jgi:SAM-dependent methyltransferase
MKEEEKPPGLNPGEILGISGAYWKSLALHAGVRLDLFSVIGEGRLAGDEIAGKIEGDERGVTTLLNALAALGFLDKEKGRFSNTPAGKTFLTKDSPRYVGSMIRHHANLVDSWSRLDEAARAGAPVRGRASEAAGTTHEDFIMGMHSNSMAMAPRAAEEIDLGGRRKLLDLGGGPGTWSVHFVRANPRLTATVFDLPATRPFAEKTIARFGVSDHVTFHAGDFHEDELPCCYDVAWLSHILHGEGPESCQRIIEKTVDALEPGGLLLVHEFILDEDKAGPLFPALFSLNMLSGTPAGRSYSRSELEAMLEMAGVGSLQVLPFRGPTESRIICGTIP